MADFFLVETKLIRSTKSVSDFDSSMINKLAQLILDANGLIRPLVLKQTGFEQYEIISGHLEYYAAVRAKEKDPRKAEMVNAMVIDSEEETIAIRQTQFLDSILDHALNRTMDQAENQPESPVPGVTPLDDLASELGDLFKRQLKAMNETLETNLRDITNQLPKRTKPIDTLNQLDPPDLIRRLNLVGLKGKNASKVIEQIIKQRPYQDLSEVVQKVNGLSAETMVKLVDTLADLIFV